MPPEPPSGDQDEPVGRGRSAPAGTWVIDLDGVVWLAGEPVAGVGDAVARLRSAGVRVLFASNNSALSLAEICQRLARAGVEAGPGDIVTSSQAAASMIEPGSSAMVVGEEGIRDALLERGVDVVEPSDRAGAGGPPPDVVVVGWSRRFDFAQLAAASGAVRGGARLIGTNDDATFPTPSGLLPGAGSLVAAVATASGTAAELAGKPHEPIARLIEERFGPVAVVVGDRPSTDGALARRLGATFALVLSGVTQRGDTASRDGADLVADDLGGIVAARVG